MLLFEQPKTNYKQRILEEIGNVQTHAWILFILVVINFLNFGDNSGTLVILFVYLALLSKIVYRAIVFTRNHIFKVTFDNDQFQILSVSGNKCKVDSVPKNELTFRPLHYSGRNIIHFQLLVNEKVVAAELLKDAEDKRFIAFIEELQKLGIRKPYGENL